MSSLMLMDSDVRSDFGLAPITDIAALTDHNISPEMLDAEPGILYVAREDVAALPFPVPLQLKPDQRAEVLVDPAHDFIRTFGDRVRISGRSGLTQAGSDIDVLFDGNGQPYARITNRGYSILGADDGVVLELGAAFVHSTKPTQGAELTALVANVQHLEHQERPWRVVSPEESGLEYEAVAMPVEAVYRSRLQHNGNGHYDRCLNLPSIPRGTHREALYEHIGLDPQPLLVHSDEEGEKQVVAALRRDSGLVISTSQRVSLPYGTGLLIQHAVAHGPNGSRRLHHLNSPALKSHRRSGKLYDHGLIYETDGTPDEVIAYAYHQFRYA